MLFAVGFFVYFFLSFSNVDPVLQLLPSEYTMEEYDAVAAEFGYDQPVVIQYFNWFAKAIQGDFGISLRTRGPVWGEIRERIPVSLRFSAITTFLVVLVGLPLGVLCAVKQYTIADIAINFGARIFASVPAFLLGIVFMLFFAVQLGWLPTFGFSTPRHWVLPLMTQVIPISANFIRNTRSSMLDCIRQDYVRTARSKGAKESQVIFKDTLRNALLPIITLIGGMFGFLISGSIVVENVFAIPGIGSKVIESINSKDMPVVMICTMLLSSIFMLMNLLIDLCYTLIDPRIKSTLIKSKKKIAKIETNEGGAA